MSKTLEQIQEENRKAIDTRYGLEPCWSCEADGKNWSDADGWVDCAVCNNGITLSQVLIALRGWICDEGIYMQDKTLCFERINWDLTKLKLEEQTERTQREVNELLTNNNKESDE